MPPLLPEIYVATNIEVDGPIPGPNSLLSFGSAAYQADKTLLGTFSANLVELEGATADPATAAWWRAHPDEWAACRRDAEEPAVVMPRYCRWLEALPGRPVFVGYPVAYDFLFVYWYLQRFAGHSPFTHSALDIKSYAMAMLATGYRDTVKQRMPRRWFDGRPSTHSPLDDAVEEGALLANMLRENRANGGAAKPAPRPRQRKRPAPR